MVSALLLIGAEVDESLEWEGKFLTSNIQNVMMKRIRNGLGTGIAH
jgi:hypothetical protein